ncbi:aminopeptidase N-like [Xenia sp. Carnegie-2017]|uniref:aminopeptidase N-like n=1 Tax=Xenia sp. Carnegie-2017 TaxID=2897299 RepID=UPI001F0418F6|nr:aminopeptidase N-like [Xenia sp. Carnegie-2017]
METSDDEQGNKPLLFQTDEPRRRKFDCLSFLKRKIWILVFAFAGVLALAVIVGLVATKSNSSKYGCYDYTDSDKCFFTGQIRLPKDIKPMTYKVRLHPDLKTFKFNGSVVIKILALAHTNRIVFHQKGLNFSKDEIIIKGVEDDEKIAVRDMRLDLKNEQVLIKTARFLRKNHAYTIRISIFNGNLNENLEGFYKSSYKTSSGEIRYLATTHFEATAARQAFPCFDEPAMKANFTIILVYVKGFVPLSNMPAEKTRNLGNNLLETQFMESVKMSTYLVAFVVCDFKFVEGVTKRGVKIRIWAPSELINSTGLALRSAKVVLNYYEEFFNVKYPLPKQDLIAIPDFSAGAMENWGLITYRLTSLLSNPSQSSTSNKQWVETVVAHELAHQWFGNLVTMKWWDDLWLNEGFASYVENIGVNVADPDLKMMDQFVVSNIQRSMHLDQLANSHPISVVVQNPSEISSLFDDISYHKGSSLINMLSNVMKEKNFLAGITSYLKKFQYSNAATDDLWHSLSENATIDVKSMMDTWTLQMGFPLVTITKQDDGKYIATQEHFLIDPGAKPSLKSPYNYKWQIPLTYYIDNGFSTSNPVWMKENQISLNIDMRKNGWLKFNINQTGYYRVNYPLDNWKNLAKTLIHNHQKISSSDRAGLLDDVFALARAGKVNYTTALDMSLYLHREKDYVPWRAAMLSLSYIGARLSMTSYYGLYQNYILSKVNPVLDELNYNDTGSALQRYLRDTLFSTAAYYDHKPAVKKAMEMFESFMSKNESVPPNFRIIVYEAGVRLGTRKEWEFMWRKYKNEIEAEEKRKLLSSLSSTREAWLLQRCLEYALNTSLIKSQDGDSVIISVASNPNGRLLAWDFLRSHWSTLRKRYGSEAFSFGRLLKAVTSHFQTEFYYNEVQSFFKVNSDVGSAARSLKQSYETIRSNIRWINEHENEVVDWLKRHKSRVL